MGYQPDPECVKERVARTRAAQGLPRYVEDPECLRTIAILVREPMSAETRRRKKARRAAS